MALRLKPEAAPERALEILSSLENDLRNLPGLGGGGGTLLEVAQRRQDRYMQWVENAEVQLTNFADERDVSAQLHTRFYWRSAKPPL